MGTELEYAYIAGLIDGEGTLGIYLVTDADGWTRTTVQLHCNMTHKATILYIQKVLGGTVKSLKVPESKKPQWRWGLHSTPRIVEALDKIEPYLITKKLQAELFRDFAKTITKYKGRANKLHPEIWEERTRIVRLIKEAKQVA